MKNAHLQSYVGFLYWADELSEKEKEVFLKYESWLVEAERTSMAKSYKMVVLHAMLNRGPSRWHMPITPKEVAPFFHQYLMEKEYRKRIDFSDKKTKQLWIYDEAKISKLIAEVPMTKWSGSSNGLLPLEMLIYQGFSASQGCQKKYFSTKSLTSFFSFVDILQNQGALRGRVWIHFPDVGEAFCSWGRP